MADPNFKKINYCLQVDASKSDQSNIDENKL